MNKKYGIPYWFVPHGGLDPYVFRSQKFIKKSFLNFGGRSFIENAKNVIFTAKAERDKALAVCKPKNCQIVYWPLNDDDFNVQRTKEQRSIVRQKLNIPEESFCFLYLGRLHPMKKPLETIDAIAKLDDKTHLLIIGNEFGVSIDDCKERAQKLGVSDRIHAIGPVYGEEKFSYFSAVDAYISLSYRENFNFTAAESMAAGLPVVLSKGNDLGGEIKDINCGWLLEGNNSKKTLIDLNDVVNTDQALLSEIGNNGKVWANDNLSFDRFQSSINQLI